jgi:hypothetical protein
VRFHQDNARPHIARVKTDLINKFGWDTVTHPPYSPYIAPSDYHLFPELKKHLGGTHFRTGEELKEEVLSYLRGAAGEFYDSGIKKMVHRMQKCIDLNGDCRKIVESLRFPKMYYSMPINMFFIVKIH